MVKQQIQAPPSIVNHQLDKNAQDAGNVGLTLGTNYYSFPEAR